MPSLGYNTRMNEQIEIEERMEWEFACEACYDTGTDDECEPCQCDLGRSLILNIRPL